LNPKVALFFLAYLPQFVSSTTGSTALQLLTLGLVFALLALMVVGGLGLFSGMVGEWLGSRPRAAVGLCWLTGSVFVCLALRLILPERR
jgi:threonine/homoserine/homoserine lactone efflux protein